MKISELNGINFTGGNVRVIRIDNKLYSLDAIKKIAEEKDVNVYISKNNYSNFLPLESQYTVIASKKIPGLEKSIFTVSRPPKPGLKDMPKTCRFGDKEFSVKIFNMVLSTIERLEKEISAAAKI